MNERGKTMRKLVIMLLIMLLILIFSSGSQAKWLNKDIEVWSDKGYYEVGETVTLFAKNTGEETIEPLHYFHDSHILIFDEDGEPVYWSLKRTEGGTSLNPGEVKSWCWDQLYRTWVLEQNEFGFWTWVRAPNYGEQVPVGKYTAYHFEYGSTTFWIGNPDYPGASDSHRRDNGHGDACLDWASNEHAQGREHAADS
ncbi:MAG: hypothetical protein JSV56_09935 [Methanomassiliicoccales archaeon]|nr:MAG: hypothetical protein JSV56_09935 [Methanomassiliicoccales archaeon]